MNFATNSTAHDRYFTSRTIETDTMRFANLRDAFIASKIHKLTQHIFNRRRVGICLHILIFRFHCRILSYIAMTVSRVRQTKRKFEALQIARSVRRRCIKVGSLRSRRAPRSTGVYDRKRKGPMAIIRDERARWVVLLS